MKRTSIFDLERFDIKKPKEEKEGKENHLRFNQIKYKKYNAVIYEVCDTQYVYSSYPTCMCNSLLFIYYCFYKTKEDTNMMNLISIIPWNKVMLNSIILWKEWYEKSDKKQNWPSSVSLMKLSCSSEFNEDIEIMMDISGKLTKEYKNKKEEEYWCGLDITFDTIIKKSKEKECDIGCIFSTPSAMTFSVFVRTNKENERNPIFLLFDSHGGELTKKKSYLILFTSCKDITSYILDRFGIEEKKIKIKPKLTEEQIQFQKCYSCTLFNKIKKN